MIDKINDFKINDLGGNPIKYSYKQFGKLSPTTLRYIKVSLDLSKYFKGEIGEKIVEIGIGYGGQLLVNDCIFSIKEYHLYDLQPVLILVSKYLESHILKSAYKINTINQSSGEEIFDLVISHYAFSELPSKLQVTYIKKILSKYRRGYLTMNSGKEDSAFLKNHLSIDELKKYLPVFEVVDENPLTHPGNYIISWGHQP